MSINSKLLTHKIKSISLLFLLASTALFNAVNAQIEEVGWAQSTNLSQSGTTAAPLLVKDASGLLYAFWQNSLDGYVLSTNRNGVWSEPRVIEPPFGTRAFEEGLTANAATPLYEPELIADTTQGLNAFWVNGDNQLRYSRIVTGDVGLLSTWRPPTTIASNVVKSVAAIDGNNRLHVAYLSLGDGEQVASGIYHRTSLDQGQTWSPALLIYTSSFFRQAQAEMSNLKFVFEGDSQFLVWDDRFIEQVFFASFANDSWSSPQIIDARQEDDGLNSEGPANIQGVIASGNVHLFWTAGHEGVNCSLYTRRSSNDGAEWSFSERIISESSSCPDYYRILLNGNQLYLFTKTFNVAEIRIWQEDGWSDPSPQIGLLEFIDPTSFRNVSSICPYQFAFHESDLHAVTCGQSAVTDIWSTSRPASSIETPVSEQIAWSEAETVSGDDNLILSPQIVDDGVGNLHSIWVQNGQGYSKNSDFIQVGKQIFYSRSDGTQWASPNQIFSADSMIANPALAFNSQTGNLIVVWEDTINQQLLFSQASKDNAFSAGDWSEPTAIPAPFANSSQPTIEISRTGEIYVTFLVPFNDDRNIYLVVSKDNGTTWSEPKAVLGEEISAFDIFESVETQLSSDGAMQISFVNRLLGAESIRNELYHVRSISSLEDDVIGWNTPQRIQNRFLQANPIFAHELSIDHQGVIHLIWQEWNDTQSNLWGLSSSDNGYSWEGGDQISGFGTPIGNFDLVQGDQDELHLSQLFLEVERGIDILTVRHWIFDGDEWVLQNIGSFEDIDQDSANMVMATGIGADNTLNVIFSGAYSNQGRPTLGVFSSYRMVELGFSIDESSIISEEDVQTEVSGIDVSEADDGSSEIASEAVSSEEAVATVPPQLPSIEGENLTPIEAFAASGSMSIGLTLAFVVFVIMLLGLGGYFAVRLILNRQ